MWILSVLWDKLFEFLDYRILEVWHHDSPGMRVYVYRNKFHRALRSRSFSTCSDTVLLKIK